MISKKEYLKAKQIIEKYEQQIKVAKYGIKKAKDDFPLNSFVVSKLNTAVRGNVIDYKLYNGTVKLILDKKDGKNTSVLIHNAVIV